MVSGFDLAAFVRILAVGAVLLVLAAGAGCVYLVGVYARHGERPPPSARCAPGRCELLAGRRQEADAADFMAWEAEVLGGG